MKTTKTFEDQGYSPDEVALLETCGLLPADLGGWDRVDAMALAGACNHQGIDPGMTEYLFTTYKGNLTAAFEDMAEDTPE